MSDPLFPSTPQAPLMSTGTAGPRTISVSRMIATPKLPTALNSQSSSMKIGFSNQRNQPQSIARLKLGIPAFS